MPIIRPLLRAGATLETTSPTISLDEPNVTVGEPVASQSVNYLSLWPRHRLSRRPSKRQNAAGDTAHCAPTRTPHARVGSRTVTHRAEWLTSCDVSRSRTVTFLTTVRVKPAHLI